MLYTWITKGNEIVENGKKRYQFKKFEPDLKEELKKSRKLKLLFDVETAKLKLAHKLAQIREKAHLTQADLAKKMGVSQQLISRVESGSDNLTLETLVRFLDLLGICMKIHLEKRKRQEILEFA
jgi:DNA-binding XRE family transcriptional regulator